MSFLGFGQSADIEIQLDDSESRKTADIKAEDGRKERCYLFYDGESISGKIFVKLKKMGMKLEHQGIKIEFIGQIEVYYDRGNHLEFISLIKDLARPGELLQNTVYPFEFVNVEKPYESYTGANVRLRYFLRVTIVRRLTDLVRELDIVVHTLSLYRDEMNSNIKMEVGIEDCLHIEFEYNRSKYHLKDAIVGKIYFLLVRIKIKHMEIAIIKRETVGSGVNVFNENETIAKYEIMDGAPVRGESIPIRLFLAGYDLTPTMREVNKKFSVRYFLNLVLVDEEDRRYFKQQEIVLWRKAEKVPRKPLASITPSAVMDRKPDQGQQPVVDEDEGDLKGGPAGAGFVPSGTATKFIPTSSDGEDLDSDSDILKPPPLLPPNAAVDESATSGLVSKSVPPQPRPRGKDPATADKHSSQDTADSLGVDSNLDTVVGSGGDYSATISGGDRDTPDVS